ncbi:MAG: hypothetical protein AAFX56_12345 [Pseudomonadota bacterium]
MYGILQSKLQNCRFDLRLLAVSHIALAPAPIRQRINAAFIPSRLVSIERVA